MSWLSINLLGEPRWYGASGVGNALSPQDAVLFARLALDGPQSRDVLAGQAWPDVSQQKAAANLRQHVRRLRRTTGHPVLRHSATLALVDEVVVDVLHLADRSVEELLDAEFLAGCDYGRNEFDHLWVTQKRCSVRAMRADALAAHAEALEKCDELAAAIRLAERTIELSPQHEHAVRRAMRLHYLRGDHTAAIAVFERFENLLREDTGARPGPETLHLLTTIERGSRSAGPPSKVLPVGLTRPPVLIGREGPWTAMQQGWAAGRAFLLVGEAGIGKSRLLGDFVQGRVGAVHERARPGDAETPYQLLGRLLRAALASTPPLAEGLVRSELSRILPELGPAPQAPAQEGLLRHAAESVLAVATASGMTAITVDDLHYADRATLEALRWFGASPALAALRFGFASRPLETVAAGSFLRDWLDDSCRPDRIVLATLTGAEIDRLLEALGLPDFVVPGLGERLHAHTGGSPLFTLETLKDCWLHRRDLRNAALPYPSTLHAMIERRLRELPRRALELARIAAVCGSDLTAERAAALLGRSLVEVTDAWATLMGANVLADERFAHELVAERALALVPEPLRRGLHARVAELLGVDPTVPPARIAEHWQAAERWEPAGVEWQRAGAGARAAGRLPEQQALLEKAAACFRRAGNGVAEFEAVHATFEGLQVRHGGTAVLAALPRLEALVTTPKAELQCSLAEAEALLDLERADAALRVATRAVKLAAAWPLLLADALALQGMALAQLTRDEEAVHASRHAVEAAAAPLQESRALRSLAYVLYRAGRLGEALPVQQRQARLARETGDAPDSAAAEASTAALLAATGDTPGSLEHARRARSAYGEMGLTQASTNGAINLCVLGRAAAYLGRFEESIEALTAALAMAGDTAAASVQAKARIALAMVRLRLGDARGARRLAEVRMQDAPPGMQMQAACCLALAEQALGGSGAGHFARLARLGVEHPEPPLVLSAWIEWSYQGDPGVVLARLGRVRAQFQAMGLGGTARSLLLRETDRLAELDDVVSRAHAAENARVLMPDIRSGLHAGSYPPEGWSILAHALERVGEAALAEECRRCARAWIMAVALPHVPRADRDGFLEGNPINRRLLESADRHVAG